jgi:hypothetical protein
MNDDDIGDGRLYREIRVVIERDTRGAE